MRYDRRQFPCVQPAQAAFPASDFLPALGTASQVRFQLAVGVRSGFAIKVFDPLFVFWVVHKATISFGIVIGFRSATCARLRFTFGSRTWLNQMIASAIREFTVPSGSSRISAI